MIEAVVGRISLEKAYELVEGLTKKFGDQFFLIYHSGRSNYNIVWKSKVDTVNIESARTFIEGYHFAHEGNE